MIRTPDVHVTHRPDGSTLLWATHDLPPYPATLITPLNHWADHAPDREFLTEAGGRTLTYAEARDAARTLASGLLSRGLSAERPVMILSGNSIDHAVLGLACLWAGVPYAPVSTAYSLLSTDHAKLGQMVALTTPGLVFAEGDGFAAALRTLPPDVEVLTSLAPLHAAPAALPGAGPDDVAKLLFTSGSTGAPKAVINTHRMLCANQAMIGAHFRFLANAPPVMVDWLPWSHTFGGNNNFNCILTHGGTLHIDAGRPMPGQFGPTLERLRTVTPTVHMAVPKGWDVLAGHLDADPALNRRFWSRMQLPFYAAASLPQPLWDRLGRLSAAATGAAVPMYTGLGSTETAPMAFVHGPGNTAAGHVGLPVCGIEVKLAPVGPKLEARVRGPSITPGYWRDAARTADSFDDEGYFRMGDALAWVGAEPAQGLRFDGRLTEDFKLLSGTWVSVGPLRARFIEAMAPWVRDAVIAGHGRDWLGALLILPEAETPELRARLRAVLAAQLGGSASRIVRVAMLDGAPSIDAGEITDKGSLNQATLLRRRAAEVAALYADPPPAHVICWEGAHVPA